MLRLFAVACFLCLLLTACPALGPDYQRPDIDVDIPGQYGQPACTGATKNFVSPDQWWREFDDTRLNQIVNKVMEGNPDIHSAMASVLEAKARAGQARADRFPSLDLTFQSSRQKQSTLDPFSGDIISLRTDAFSASLPAAFELDLWGRLRRASEAARADLLAAEQNRQTVVQSLIAEAATRYFTIQSLKKQVDLLHRLIRSHQDNLKLVEARYQRGLTSVQDVHQARRALARTRAEIPPLMENLKIACQTLAVLQGDYPDISPATLSEKNDFKLPPPVPAGLPSELLNRRPDIRSAEAALAAACARIGAAKANRFPRISLTGTFGYNSDELDLLLKPESEIWKIGSGIFQPLFDAGQRKNLQKAAEARYQKQLAVYAQTVLTAFAEVEGALVSRAQQIERFRHLLDVHSEAEATLTTTRERYQRGLTNSLQVLDAQQTKLRAELDLIRTQYSIITNRITLYRALGGGWGNRKK